MNRKQTRSVALLGTALMLAFTALTVWPEDAEARRFGGGSSFGSRSSRSFSAPRQAAPRTPGATTTQQRQGATQPGTAAPATSGMRSGLGSGLMGGIGGFMLGGLLGSMMFGGMGGGLGGGGGIGLFDIILIGGLIWFGLRWLRRRKEEQAGYSQPVGGFPPQRYDADGGFPGQGGPAAGGAMPQTFDLSGNVDEVSQGIEHIAGMDPNFNEAQFLEGAKMAFKMVQGSWADWSVERLRPLLTDRMWGMAQAQAQELKESGQRTVVEKIQFDSATVNEAWQESGEDWLTVRFEVQMVDYLLDLEGNLLEGDRDAPVRVEEFWTFTRPAGTQDPNWRLAAIQQPGEVARGSL